MSGILGLVGPQTAGLIAGAYLSGNRCGHNPAVPRLDPIKPVPRNLPSVIVRLCDRFQEYFDNPGLLPSLNAANGSDRQQRSERREAIILVFLVLMKYFNLLTGRTEIPTERGGLIALTIDWIAKQAGIGFKRAQRALWTLAEAGILEIKNRARLTESGYRGVAAIRVVSKHVFQIFGLWDEMRRQMKYREEEAKRKAQQLVDRHNPGAAEQAMFLKGKLGRDAGRRRGGHNERLKNDALAEQRREIQLLALELKREHPDWPVERIQREAAMQLARKALKN